MTHPKKKTVKKKIYGYGIVFKNSQEMFTTIMGLGAFDYKEWAKIFLRKHRLEKDADIIPIIITYEI